MSGRTRKSASDDDPHHRHDDDVEYVSPKGCPLRDADLERYDSTFENADPSQKIALVTGSVWF
jgi:hypothetical protein